MSQKEIIYIAGPDVFLPNAIEAGKKMVQVCRQYGFEAFFPIDDEAAEADIGNPESARMIFYGNIDRIKASDIIVANLKNFRGSEPDSGTSFECGFGHALGKHLYGYIPHNRTTVENAQTVFKWGLEKIGKAFMDPNGYFVEDFSLPLNLMLSVPMTIVVGSFEDCVRQVAKDRSNELLNHQQTLIESSTTTR